MTERIHIGQLTVPESEMVVVQQNGQPASPPAVEHGLQRLRHFTWVNQSPFREMLP